jgi:ABC-2 type transport system ATP-binding protein
MPDTILQTNDLCKIFKGQTAVNNLSMSIEKGSIYGLLGPNGAGKSTTLKMLTGMLRPTSGQIIFEGRPFKRKDLDDIGCLIESPPLYENLTAHENLKVRTTLLGLPESHIHEVLATVDLTGTGKKRAGQFSMGMKQRLGIALALFAGHFKYCLKRCGFFEGNWDNHFQSGRYKRYHSLLRS